MSLELFGTCGCHLCEDAETLVAEVIREDYPDMRLTLIDIADDPSLMAAFGLRIPVLRWQNRLLEWPFTSDDIAKFLKADNTDSQFPISLEQPS